MTVEEAIKLWKEKNIDECLFIYDCGGDSMGDTTIELRDVNGNEISCEEIKDFFDNEVYNQVDFYVNSDGHYQGESGTVRITLEDGDEEFEYCKSATYEYCETASENITIKLTDDEVKFLKDKKVTQISGNQDNDGMILYEEDCILTNEEEEIKDSLLRKIEEEAEQHQHDIPDGETNENDWFGYNTNINDESTSITLEGNGLLLNVLGNYTRFSEE